MKTRGEDSMKRSLLIIGVLLIMGLSGCGTTKYKLTFDGYGLESAGTSYAEGEKVTVTYDMIATDTDYSFSADSDDVKLDRDFDGSHGYVLTFTMPAHDVKISVKSRNTMEMDPDANPSGTVIVAPPQESTSLDTETWFCPECGAKNNRRFCAECGFDHDKISKDGEAEEADETPETADTEKAKSPDKPAPISKEQALEAIKNYCYANNPDLKDMEGSDDYTFYWDVSTNDAGEIVVLYRSYTSAQIRYYIDPASGETYVTELVPGIIDEEQRSEETLNVRDYLP